MLIHSFCRNPNCFIFKVNVFSLCSLTHTAAQSLLPMSPFYSSFLLILLFIQQQCPTEYELLFSVSLFIKSISQTSSAICLLPSGPPLLLSSFFNSLPTSIPLSPSSSLPTVYSPHTLFPVSFLPLLFLNAFFRTLPSSPSFSVTSLSSLILPFFLTLVLNEFNFQSLTLFPPLSLLFCSRSTSSIS